MAQDTFADFSATSSNNSTIEGDATDGSVSVAEGNLPSTINNAVRIIMAACNASFGDLPSGTSRPSYVTSGRFWKDTTTATAPIIKFYDGTDDISVFTIDTTANTVSFSGAGGGLDNIVEDLSPQLGAQLDVNGFGLGDGTLELLTFVEDGSAVNHVQIENEATGSGPIIRGTGDDATVDLNLATKSSGTINLNAAVSASSTVSVTGVLDIASDLAHTGDADTKLAFGTNTQDLRTGGSSRLDMSNSGVRLGGSGARVTTILDEDAMGTDSATALATQQSIKAYVDAAGGGFTLSSVVDTSGSILTSANFTGLPSGVNQIDVLLDQVSVNSTSGYIMVQIGDSGGVGTSGYSSRAGSGDVSSSGFAVASLANDSNVLNGVISLRRVTGSTWVASGVLYSTAGAVYASAGRKALSGTLDRVRLTTSIGSPVFDSGQASIQYQ